MEQIEQHESVTTNHLPYANMMNASLWRYGPRGRWLFPMMVLVIVFFVLAYAFLLAHHLYYMFIFSKARDEATWDGVSP